LVGSPSLFALITTLDRVTGTVIKRDHLNTLRAIVIGDESLITLETNRVVVNFEVGAINNVLGDFYTGVVLHIVELLTFDTSEEVTVLETLVNLV
jgi:hypothetical protein